MGGSLTELFDQDGYVVARGLFSAEETGKLRDHFMALWQTGRHSWG